MSQPDRLMVAVGVPSPLTVKSLEQLDSAGCSMFESPKLIPAGEGNEDGVAIAAHSKRLLAE